MDASLLSGASTNILASATGAMAITPSDSVDLAQPVRAITIAEEGTLSFTGLNGHTYTTGTLPAGTYPVIAKRVRATGTTATGITGWI
jgi:hypothetical protein